MCKVWRQQTITNISYKNNLIIVALCLLFFTVPKLKSRYGYLSCCRQALLPEEGFLEGCVS